MKTKTKGFMILKPDENLGKEIFSYLSLERITEKLIDYNRSRMMLNQAIRNKSVLN